MKKQSTKRIFAMLLTVVMLLSAVPLGGFVGLDLFSTKASAVDHKVGDIVEFGSYPQSEVKDSATLNALNKLSLNWTSYGYYTGNDHYGSMVQSDYIKYADVVFNNSKYRSVLFTKYRPYFTTETSHTGNSNQDNNGYKTNTVYWFKYEPLRWRVLDPTTGYIMCENLIDSQAFSNFFYGESMYENCYNDITQTNFANDWATSSIREWLNNDFCNTAFTSIQKAQIVKSNNLHNSNPEYSTYSSTNTDDDIYLPSYSDMVNSNFGFNAKSSVLDTARIAKGTDYAKCQGESSAWWLRTPGKYSSRACYCFDGKASSSGSEVNRTHYGIRPAMRLSNLSDLNQGGTEPETKENEIKLYASVPSMTIGTNETMDCGIEFIKNGERMETQRSYSIVLSNPTIAKISNIKFKNDKATHFDFSGLREGVAKLTITDNETGTVFSTDVVVLNNILVYNSDYGLPKYSQKNEIYNLYVNGIYISDYSAKKLNNNNMSVSFNAWNSKGVVGSVDVYDANGNLIKCQPIKRYDGGNATGLKDVVVDGYYLIKELVNGELLTFKQDSCTQHTPINITVPMGGHIEITNDLTYSKSCALYNAAEYAVESILLISGVVKSGSDKQKKEIGEIVGKNVVDKFIKECLAAMDGLTYNDKIYKLGEKFTEKFAKKTTGKILNSVRNDAISSFADDCKDTLNISDIDLEKLIISASVSVGASIAEDALEKAMGPIGAVLKGLFAFSKMMNYVWFYTSLCQPAPGHGAYIYYNTKDGFLCDNGVTIKPENGNTNLGESNFVMHSFVVSNNKDLSYEIKESIKKYGDKCVLRNIYLERDGVVSQPGQTVEVFVPVPDNFDINKCSIYWIQDDGTMNRVNTTIVDGMLKFKTNHFSYYALVDETPRVSSISFPQRNIETNYNRSFGLGLAVDKIGDIEYSTEYKSSNSNVVTVDNNGNINTNDKGNATITVTVTDSNGNVFTDYCEITVKFTFWQWVLFIVLFGWIWM